MKLPLTNQFNIQKNIYYGIQDFKKTAWTCLRQNEINLNYQLIQ